MLSRGYTDFLPCTFKAIDSWDRVFPGNSRRSSPTLDAANHWADKDLIGISLVITR